MKLRDHLLLSGAASLAIVPAVGPVGTAVFFGSSVLIDVDHYGEFVSRSGFKDWSPRRMFRFYGELVKLRDPDSLALHPFHTIEWFLVVYLATVWTGSSWGRLALWGMAFHMVLDLAHLWARGVITTRALSVVEYFVRRHATLRRGGDPDRRHNAAMSMIGQTLLSPADSRST